LYAVSPGMADILGHVVLTIYTRVQHHEDINTCLYSPMSLIQSHMVSGISKLYRTHKNNSRKECGECENWDVLLGVPWYWHGEFWGILKECNAAQFSNPT
jgi:hypothetical protein